MIDNTIIVETINNSYLYIDTTPSISAELSDHFSFFAPNYKFMPAYKNGKWDGKIRLYKMMNSTLPVGLFNLLSKFASDNNYTVIDRRIPNKLKTPSESEIEVFLSDLNIHANGDEIKHHDHQVDGIKTALIDSRATILSATSSGKSLQIYSIIRWYLEKIDGKILLIVPTVGLVDQMYSDFIDYASHDEWSVHDNIHLIKAGKKKDSDKRIYISTWQSIFKQKPEYFEQFECVICDEVHVASAKSISYIMDNCINAHIRLGFTGTLKDTKIHQLFIVSMFGDIKNVASARLLMDKGLISSLDIRFVVFKYPIVYCKEVNKRVVEKVLPGGVKKYRDNYRFESNFVETYAPRYVFVLNLIKHLKGNTLILFNKVEKQGKPLFSFLKKKLDNTQKKIYYISGETKPKERERIRKEMEKGDDSILVASYGTLSTGVNIKNLKYVIFFSPYKSEIKVLQSIGRVLRKAKGKTKAVVFDLVDDFRYKKYVNYFYKHFMKRYEIYKKERFPVSVSEYNLK